MNDGNGTKKQEGRVAKGELSSDNNKIFELDGGKVKENKTGEYARRGGWWWCG